MQFCSSLIFDIGEHMVWCLKVIWLNTNYELRAKNLKARVEDLKKHELKFKSWFQIRESQVQIHQLRVQIHILRFQIYKLRVQIYELQVQIHELRVQIYQLRVQIQSYKFKSTSSIIIKSKKTQVNSIKNSSFLKIISPKVFGNHEVTRTFSFWW